MNPDNTNLSKRPANNVSSLLQYKETTRINNGIDMEGTSKQSQNVSNTSNGEFCYAGNFCGMAATDNTFILTEKLNINVVYVRR